MSDDLSKVDECPKDHGLELNPEKCSVLLFTSPEVYEQLVSNNMIVTDKNIYLTNYVEIKVLSVTINAQLNFSSHLKQECNRVTGKINVLKV